MELALIGLNFAGKSTLVEVLASGNFNQDLFTTVSAVQSKRVSEQLSSDR